jgi:uncharacterized Zn-finger protein
MGSGGRLTTGVPSIGCAQRQVGDKDLLDGEDRLMARVTTAGRPGTASGQTTPNAQRRYELTRAQLPAHCPTDEMSLWNSHPRVYFPLKNIGDEATCPYCSTVYVLVEG